MNKLSPQSQKQQLKQEVWYHGSVSRSEAESMLTRVNIFFLSKFITDFIYYLIQFIIIYLI